MSATLRIKSLSNVKPTGTVLLLAGLMLYAGFCAALYFDKTAKINARQVETCVIAAQQEALFPGHFLSIEDLRIRDECRNQRGLADDRPH